MSRARLTLAGEVLANIEVKVRFISDASIAHYI